MTDQKQAPERIWAVFERHPAGGEPRVFACASKTKGQEFVRKDLYESLAKQRDELAAENASLITARDMMGRLLANAIAEREEARSASAVREIAMRDRAAACSYGYLGAAHIREKISALPLSPDGQQALDDMLADAWDNGRASRGNPAPMTNPYRQPSRSSDAGKSEDRG